MEPAKRQSRNTKSTNKKLSLIGNMQKSTNSIALTQQKSRIALSAYYKAQARGFAPGHELEDWLAAEAELNQ